MARRRAPSRRSDDDDDDGTEGTADRPSKVLPDPALPRYESGGEAVRSLRYRMAAMLNLDPGLAINLRDEIPAWVGGGMQSGVPETLRAIVSAGIREGCTRGQIAGLLRDANWLGPDFAISMELWDRIQAESDGAPSPARVAALLDDTPLGDAGRAEMILEATVDCLRAAQTSPPEFRGEMYQNFVTLAQQLRIEGLNLQALRSMSERGSSSSGGGGGVAGEGTISGARATDMIAEFLRSLALKRSRAESEAGVVDPTA